MLRRFSYSRRFTASFVSCSSSRRFCSSKTETPTVASAVQGNNSNADDQICALVKRCRELDDKCFSWTLTQQDMEEVVQTLADITSGKITQPEISPASNPEIPYPDLENPQSRGVEVPYTMSTLLRCVFQYPEWRTMSIAPGSKGSKQSAATERMPVRRPNCPHREPLAAPIQICNLPSSVENPGSRVFVLGSSEKEFDQFSQEMKDKFGGFITEKIAGYECFQLAQLTMMAAQQQQQQTENATGVVKFHGISLNPNKERMVLLGSDAKGLTIARNLSCDAALENALVLIKWLVEESSRTVLTGHQGGFVSSCVASVLERASYYVLQDSNHAAFIFTSMHHLLRYKSFAENFAKDDWEKRGPWTVGTTEAANIDWVMGGKRSPVINPIAPGDEVAINMKFPASNIQFSVPGIEQMVGIIDHMKKNMQQQQPSSSTPDAKK